MLSKTLCRLFFYRHIGRQKVFTSLPGVLNLVNKSISLVHACLYSEKVRSKEVILSPNAQPLPVLFKGHVSTETLYSYLKFPQAYPSYAEALRSHLLEAIFAVRPY